MARTALTTGLVSVAARQLCDISAGAQDIPWEAGDDVEGNSFTPTGKDLLLVRNTDVGAQTVKVTAKSDEYGRSGDTGDYSLAADDVAYIGIIDVDGFKQTDGEVYIDVSDSGVELCVLALP